jgi:hypothetical protein
MPRVPEYFHSQLCAGQKNKGSGSTTEDIKLRILAANLRKQFAKDILFTSDYIITKPLGDFSIGESVKNLSIADIFIRLLGLTSQTTDPESPPSTPDTPENLVVPDAGPIVTKIIQNQVPLYQLDFNYQLEAVPYKFCTFTEETYKAEPIDKLTAFYQKKDTNGDMIESGYQHCTEMQEMYYVVALPEELIINQNVTLQTWSGVEKCWKSVTSNLTSNFSEIKQAFADVGLELADPPQGYTIWADLSDVDPGTNYRFIITE